tara:strand:+ start:855 stop:1610 length:756 start_codon:yes stop_codon:yes gene_type:complete
MFNFYKLGKKQYYFQDKKRVNITRESFLKDEYWNLKNLIDPDGKKRNLITEKKKKLTDLKNEIKFIKDKKKGGSIIDLGSGLGHFLSGFDKNWKKVGIELSPSLNVYSEKYAKIYNYDLEKKLPNIGKFDFIFSYHVIEHLKKPENFVKNIKRLSKKNTVIIIGTPNFDSGASRHFKKNYRFFHDRTHISFFSELSMYRMFSDFGFKVLKVDFPFFKTKLFNKKNLLNLFNTKKNSPPFYGNIMTFYLKLR